MRPTDGSRVGITLHVNASLKMVVPRRCKTSNVKMEEKGEEKKNREKEKEKDNKKQKEKRKRRKGQRKKKLQHWQGFISVTDNLAATRIGCGGSRGD